MTPFFAIIVTIIALFIFHTWMQSQSRGTWPNRFGRKVAKRFGYTPLYWPDETGDLKDPYRDLVWEYRYDDIDAMMSRPIHPGMSVAPPWAKMHMVENWMVESMLNHKKNKDALLAKYRKAKPNCKPADGKE